MKIKPIFLGLIALSVISFSSCTDDMVKPVNENGELQQEDLPNAQLDFTSANALPSYDASNLPQSSTMVTKDELNSYYSRKLNTRCIVDYNDIKTGLSKFSKEILLTKLISEQELFQIMAIINIDEPAYFMMDTKYSYTLSSDGYVEKVYLYYTMDKGEYETLYENYQTLLQNFYKSILLEDSNTSSGIKGTEYNVEKAAINAVSVTSGDNTDTSIVPALNKKSNAYSTAKMLTAYCRRVGLDCLTKIGVPTSSNLENVLKKANFVIDELTDITEYTVAEGNIKTVDYDFSGYCFWNMVKIEDKWYNVDLYLQKLIEDKYTSDTKQNEADKIITDNELLTNVTDYSISMSRMSYVSDNILGLSPASTSPEFQTTYRNNKYILSMTSSQVVQYLAKKIPDYKSSNGKEIYQFADEETFDTFIKELPRQIETYNANNKNTITSYRITYDRDSLSILIYDLQFKN